MEPGELNPDTRYGTLTINSISHQQTWVAISDMSALLDEEVRGDDRLIPHATAVSARRRRRNRTRMDFPIAFTGLYTFAGVRVADKTLRYGQLILNIEHWKSSIGIGEDAPAGVSGTVTASWARPTPAGTKTASVHILVPFRPQIHGFVAVGTLSLNVPGGRFT